MFPRTNPVAVALAVAVAKADPANVPAAAYNGIALILFDRARAQNMNSALIQESIRNARRALAVDATSMPAYGTIALIYYLLAESDRSRLDLAELVCTRAK